MILLRWYQLKFVSLSSYYSNSYILGKSKDNESISSLNKSITLFNIIFLIIFYLINIGRYMVNNILIVIYFPSKL